MRLKIFIFLIVVAVTGVIVFHYRHQPAKSPKQTASAIPVQSDSIKELKKNQQELLAIVDNRDPSAALQELQRRMDANPLVFKNCHALAHQIGHEAIRKYKFFADALQYQNATCSDGYLHGIIEETFGEQTSDIASLIDQMKVLCGSLKNLSQRCYHGVGHAIMYYTSNNLPQSLKLCESYTGAPRGRCYEGVFMQNFLADRDLHPSQYVDYKNPFYPCPQEAVKYKPYCYFYAPIFYLNQNNNDYAKALQWCETETSGFAATCAKGVGSLIVKYNIQDPIYGQNLCAASAQVRSCIAGMVSYGLTYYGTVNTVLQQMCNKMDANYKNMCTQYLHGETHLF